MIGFVLSLFGRCDHSFGWPLTIGGVTAETCTKCGATRTPRIDLTPLPRFAAPIRPLVAVEAEEAQCD